MPAVKTKEELDRTVPNKLHTCPADERVVSWQDVPDLYAPGVKRGKEGEETGEDGITRQKCGGGHRVIRKKIGGS